MRVTVVTNPELGWDCVVNVIKGNEEVAKAHFIAEAKHDFDWMEENGYNEEGEIFDGEEAIEQYVFFSMNVEN